MHQAACALALLTALTAPVAACGASAPAPASPPEADPERRAPVRPGAPAYPGGAREPVDEGQFVVFVEDQRMGEERFEIVSTEPSGYVVRSHLRLSQDGNVLDTEGELRLNGSWKPVGGTMRVRTSEGQDTVVELAMVDGRLEQTTTPSGGEARTVRAEADVDLYLGEASIAFAATLCQPQAAATTQIVLFPGTAFPVERSGEIMVPAQGDSGGTSGPGPGDHGQARPDAEADSSGSEMRALTVVAVDPQSEDSLIALCEDQDLVLLWLPAIDLAAARPGYESLALELSTRSFLEQSP